MDKTKEINREAWNTRAKKHLDSSFYDLEPFKAGKSSLREVELSLFPDLTGLKVLHIQCHFGQDSISLARMGAEVTAVDFSEDAISIANDLAKELDQNIRFICSDIMAPDLLKDETFDLVFLSYGVLNWHEDLSPMAELIERCLEPEGRMLLIEFHPFMQMFDDATEEFVHSYFSDGPISGATEGSYATEGDDEEIPYIVWNHSLGEIMSTFLGAGLNIEFMQEYDFSPYPCFNNLVEIGHERWMIEGAEGIYPMLFAIRASKASVTS